MDSICLVINALDFQSGGLLFLNFVYAVPPIPFPTDQEMLCGRFIIFANPDQRELLRKALANGSRK